MAVLGIEEIEELLDEIRERVIAANRDGTLEQLLTSMGMRDLIDVQPQVGARDGKIVVLGATEVKEAHLLGIARKLGLEKDRFEFCLDYDALQKYDYCKLQYPDKYSLILVGPMPHSTAGKADSSSVIAEMEKQKGLYPPLERMMAGGQLKITKSGFAEILKRMKQQGYIQ